MQHHDVYGFFLSFSCASIAGVVERLETEFLEETQFLISDKETEFLEETQFLISDKETEFLEETQFLKIYWA